LLVCDIRERRQPRPGLCEYRREQAAQLAMKSVQPGAVFYDGTGGHPLILSRHKSMIMRWPSRIAAPGTPGSVWVTNPDCSTGAMIGGRENGRENRTGLSGAPAAAWRLSAERAESAIGASFELRRRCCWSLWVMPPVVMAG
jgi:hypothetical protein